MKKHSLFALGPSVAHRGGDDARHSQEGRIASSGWAIDASREERSPVVLIADIAGGNTPSQVAVLDAVLIAGTQINRVVARYPDGVDRVSGTRPGVMLVQVQREAANLTHLLFEQKVGLNARNTNDLFPIGRRVGRSSAMQLRVEPGKAAKDIQVGGQLALDHKVHAIIDLIADDGVTSVEAVSGDEGPLALVPLVEDYKIWKHKALGRKIPRAQPCQKLLC